MKKLLLKLTLLFIFLLSNIIIAQVPSGYTTVLNHNFGTSGNIKNSNDLQNNYDWGLLWGDANPNNPWANAAEWQKYTALTSNNYQFASNHLKIIARFNNDINGNGKPDYAGGDDQTGTDREITSGCLRSKNTYKPTASKSYYFETRMKVPSGKALWPAFWLYRKKGGTNAEIDIVEIVNNQWDSSKEPNWDPLVYHNNVHYSSSGDNPYASAKGSSLSTAYHIWACEWTDSQVKFYLDNNHIRTVSFPINDPNTGWGNSNPANVLINLAAGGGWPGPADDTNAFPATLEVDYLKIYEKTTGGGSDQITSVSGPSSVNQGQSVTVAVDYSASTNRKIVSLLQLGESPWTSTWGGLSATASQNVNAGSGTVNLTFTIPNGVPSGSNYQYQNFITTTNGDWAQKLHNKNQYPITVTSGNNTDEITSVSGPTSVSQGQSITVTVGYNASTTRKIQSSFHLNKSPWTWYAGASKNVGAGTGSVDLTFTIPNNVPVGTQYFYQNIITTTNGGWAERLDNKVQNSITTTSSGESGYRYLKYTVTNASNHKMLELSWLAGTTNYPKTNLTSNSSESGVTVSGSFGSDSYKAFDGDLSGPNGLWIGDQTPKHILLDFGTTKISPTKIHIQKKSWSDLKGFKCEGSNDGSNWTLLYSNTASTGTWTDRTFTFTAKSALSNSNTRLKQNDGLIYPNPSNGLFNFNFSSTYKGEISIKVFTIDGRQVKDLKLQKREGRFTHTINLSNHATGIYFIKFKAGDYQSNHKIIKN